MTRANLRAPRDLAAKLVSLGALRGALLLLALAAPGCFDPVVGYPCAAGYVACGESCVDLTSNAAHCGGCNVKCDGTCTASVCVGHLGDGGGSDVSDAAPDQRGADTAGGADATPDASSDAVVPGDARADGARDAGDAGASDAPRDTTAGGDAAGDGAAGDGAAGGDAAGAGDALAMPGADAQDGALPAPGDAAVPDAGAPVSDAPPGSDAAPLVCMAGLSQCADRCVSLATDPDNCGVCDNRCGSGLCAVGICLQQGAGHVVVIGHDYVVNRSGMNNLLGNAVFLSANDPVAVLAYEGHASAGAIAGTDFAIDEVAAERGRHWQRSAGTSIDVVTALPGYDVLLIYAQQDSVNQTLTDAGLAWTTAMSSFLAAGKTIVLLDGPSASNSGTFQILRSAGLLAATARTDVTGQTLTVANPADAVALRVPRSYRAEMSSVSFTTTEPGKVVTTAGGAAVVIHRVF